MTFVIADPCIGVKDGICAKVCPVDCIDGRPGDPMLYIDPVRCIDCDVCAIACPVDAIFPADKVPEVWAHYTAINSDFFAMATSEP